MGVLADFGVDAISRYPEITTGKRVRIERGTEIGGGTIDIQDDVRIGKDTILRGDVSIGRGTNLVRENKVVGDVEIGKYCAVARGTSLQERDHEIERSSLQGKFYSDYDLSPLEGSDTGSITVGNDVWFGLDVIVVSGVDIGNGAVVGAGSVVTSDIEPFEIVGGNPADHIGWRFEEETREKMSDIRWWEWNEDRIRKNGEFFASDLTELSPREIDDLLR